MKTAKKTKLSRVNRSSWFSLSLLIIHRKKEISVGLVLVNTLPDVPTRAMTMADIKLFLLMKTSYEYLDLKLYATLQPHQYSTIAVCAI
jgi:hypothetical protein